MFDAPVAELEALARDAVLKHLDRATTFLDRRSAYQTLAYVAELWKHPVHVLTHNEDGKDLYLSVESP